jgi:glycosyltransferase 2 family protein
MTNKIIQKYNLLNETLFKKRLMKIIKLLISIIIIIIIIKSISYESFKKEISNAKMSMILLAFFLLVSRVPIMALRWKILLNIRNSECSLLSLTKYYFLGFFFNAFLPSSIGGDVARGIYTIRDNISKEVAISSILLERYLGLFALVLIGFVSYLYCINYGFMHSDILFFLGQFIGIFVFIFFVFFIIPYFFKYFSYSNDSYRIFLKIFYYLNNFSLYWSKPYRIISVLLITILCQIIGILAVYLISLSVNENMVFTYFLFLLPVIWLIALIPISLGGLGVREGAFIYLFALAGMNTQIAISISVIWLALSYSQCFIGGFFLLPLKRNV